MAIPAIIAAVGRIGASAAAGEAAGAASAGRAVAQLGQAIGQLGQTAKHTTNWVGGLASKFTGELAKGLTLVIDMVGQAAGPIERLVRVANPAMADAFGRAMADAYGVVGRMLLPVMESFIGIARKVGAVMAGLEPVFQPAIDAISKLVDAIGEEVIETLRQDAPIFEMIADAFKSAAERATLLVRVVGELARAFNELAGVRLARLLGYGGGSFNPNASAVGAAARHAQFVQPKAIADEAIKNSMMQGLGQKRAKTLDDVVDPLEKIYTFLQRRWGQVEAFKRGATDGAGVSRDDVRDFAAGIQQGALDRFRIARPNR